jgi:hypothetical protein
MSKDKTSTTPGLDKDALDALNFKNNILEKIERAKLARKNKTSKTSAKPPVIKGLGKLGEHRRAYKKRNTRKA